MDYLLSPDGVTPLNIDYKNSLSNPQDVFFESFGNRRNDSGVRVTESTALTYSSVFAATNLISSDVARVALNIYERTPDDNREKRRDHPAYRLLNRRSSPYQPAFTFRQTLMSHALLHGNGYARIFRDRLARPYGLEILAARQVTPKLLTDGRLVYEFTHKTGATETIASDDVFHVKGLGDDGIQGHSIIKLASNSWGMGLAAEKHGNKHFSKGARPNIVLKTAARLDKQQADALLDSFEARHNGADGVGRPALAAGGLEVMPLTISNSDAQWLQSRAFQRIEVAAWFGLPPHKLGDSSRVAYNSLEAEERSYVAGTLMRWFKAWEAEVESKLMTERELDADWYAEHNVDGLIQGDFSTQTATAVQLRSAMIISQNEARKKLNLPTIEGGDTFENPATSSGSQQDAPPAAEEPAGIDETAAQAHRELVADRLRHFVKTEVSQLQRLAKTANNITEAVANYYESWNPKVVDGLRPCVKACEAVGLRFSRDVSALVDDYCEQSLEAVTAVLANGSPRDLLPGEIRETCKNWTITRVENFISNLEC